MPLRQVSVALLAQGLGEGLKMKGYEFKVLGCRCRIDGSGFRAPFPEIVGAP